MKTAVLVPSHIHYPDQLDRLDTCLDSLCSQTVVPDIFVSISFENDTYNREFSTLLRKYPTVKFKLSAQQKFQMEHLFTLSRLINDYDMIMFCDDDDTYLSIRVEMFVKAFTFTKENCEQTGFQLGGVREVEDPNDNNESPEYWAYGIPPSLLTTFFNRINGYEDLMRNKFADMYLRNYLKRTNGTSIRFCVLPPHDSGLTLYQYTIDNPNSICAKLSTKHKTAKEAAIAARNTLTLGLICNNDDIIKKQMLAISIPLLTLNTIVPDTDRIKTLIQVLYV